MLDDRAVVAFALALAVSLVATPLARRLAVATEFYDHPVRHKAHRRPTPYLGGLAVLAAFLVGAAPFAESFSRFEVVVGCALALAVVGTIDDRIGLGVAPRLGVQVAAAVVAWGAGLGWNVFDYEFANLAVTLVWVVGLINAFNLMDNVDGASATVAAVSATGAGAIALGTGAPEFAAPAFALAGACAGFLPYNLARPSRIFLGDGGSMPIGFVAAAIVMSIPAPGLGWATLLAAAPLVGLVIFDTALVVISRRRRGAPVLVGARDHLTHRLLARLGGARRVAVTLGAAQAVLCVLAAQLYVLEKPIVGVVGASYLVIGLGVITLLETRSLAARTSRRGVRLAPKPMIVRRLTSSRRFSDPPVGPPASPDEEGDPSGERAA